MKIKKSSLLYKIAYATAIEHHYPNYIPPDQTSFCELIFNLIISLLFFWPAMLIVISPLALFFGRRLTLIDNWKIMFIPFNLPQFKGYRILPIYFVILYLTIFYPHPIIFFGGKILKIVWSAFLFTLLHVVIPIVVFLLMLAVIYKFVNSKLYAWLEKYLMADIGRMCKTVYFTND